MRQKDLALALLVIASSVNAELLDPRTRNEDISGTGVSVAISQDALGLYHYDYTLTSPVTNKGTIGSFNIDIGCSARVKTKFDLSKLGLNTNSLSKDGLYVPVASSGDGYPLGVTMDNRVMWGHNLRPGHTSHDTLISAYKPGVRMFTIEPRMSPEGYDYASYEYEPGLFPWIPDFTVSAYTKGPACPENKQPLKRPRFPGTKYPNETNAINQLLTYSTPTRDRFHVDSKTKSIDITVYYGDNTDPSTFSIETSSHSLKRLFHPRAGSHETITIPLGTGRNRVTMRIKSLHTESVAATTGGVYQDRGPDTDQDEFGVYMESIDEKYPSSNN